ncbi:MAG: metal-sensing transcriptional repressor [Hyphomicrobiales bacterium]|nr:metal-sensing transcriptional repressor [Hyphomicrobiales bacterium]MBV8770436.1 metal-sensing transcriptional repressor [Hyphomicrobiales bacterium]MBV9053337.1 metal-sensing transcriptional repressor [Hyphomicrobiales bacterium]MBV9973774.1 metal-sensing transcriptional repressor [Hyphomicrobiales bacterium]
MKHRAHPEILKRLKQAHGQLASVLSMFANGRSCTELAQQLQAVESIIHMSKRLLIHDHMEHCIGDALGEDGFSADEALREFKTLSKYL